MLKVDSINIWPATADNLSKQDAGWDQGICSLCTTPYTRLAKAHQQREWYSAMMKTVNIASSPPSIREIESLFNGGGGEDVAPPPPQRAAIKRSLEELQVESSQQIAEACLPDTHAVTTTTRKKLATEHERRVRHWIEVYQKEGRAGNVGLVPEPLRQKYPTKAPLDLDPDTFAYVCHFAEWNQKNSLL